MVLQVPEWGGADAATFIDFWSRQYVDKFEHLYDRNIGRELTAERVRELFRWKNGTRIAGQKERSIRDNYLPELDRRPGLETLDDGRTYLARLRAGTIWNIFWLHCLRPDLFPIFDQHTYRAMVHIDALAPGEIPEAGRQKIDIYFGQFVPFFGRFGHVDRRQLDKALLAYGRFCKWGFRGR